MTDNLCLLLKEVDKLVNAIIAEIYVKQMERMSNVPALLRVVSKTEFAWIYINLINLFFFLFSFFFIKRLIRSMVVFVK